MVKTNGYMAMMLGIVVLTSGCAMMSERKALGNPDAMFLLSTARASQAEVELSRIAAERAQNPAVKQYAQQVLDDHRQMNRELTQLAQNQDLSIPNEPDQLHEKVAAHLSRLSGAEFDREYVTEMLGDHAKMLAKFENKARLAQDAQVRQWAATKVPAFRKHYEMAQSLNERLVSNQ